MELPIYMDHAATTPVRQEVLEAMLPYFCHAYGNPSAIYAAGLEAHDAAEAAREQVAEAVGAAPDEIYFTSGGTEADNWAVFGAAQAAAPGKRHVLCSSVEHHAVLEACRVLEERGFRVEWLPVDAEGLVSPDEFRRRLRPDTCLVCVMHANNEVGAVQPIEAVGALCRAHRVHFHCDAVQTLGSLPLDMRRLQADTAAFSAHKLYGPKGVGALYVRRGAALAAGQKGGSQERGKRAGTLNVPGLVGFGRAAELARMELPAALPRLAGLRDRLIASVLAGIPGARLCGPRAERLPGNAHFVFAGVEAEAVLLGLDALGIQASAGSACTAGSNEPSHVLLAMGVAPEEARGALRLTLGRSTTQEAVDYAVRGITQVIGDLRRLGGA